MNQRTSAVIVEEDEEWDEKNMFPDPMLAEHQVFCRYCSAIPGMRCRGWNSKDGRKYAAGETGKYRFYRTYCHQARKEWIDKILSLPRA